LRLSRKQVEAVRRAFDEVAGSSARVRLFGSRLRDDVRGGDVDLLVTLDQPIEAPAWMAARLEARISRALEGRSVDVILKGPNLASNPLQRIAEEQGIDL